MNEIPRLIQGRKRHYPLPKGREPQNDREYELVFRTELDMIDDLIDDSLRFIDEELSRIGLGLDQRAVVKARLCYGLLSVWAGFSLAELQSDFAGTANIDLVDKYFEEKFGRPRASQ